MRLPLESGVTYNVYRCSRSSGAFGKPVAARVQSNAYTDTKARKESPFWYVVTAVDSDGRESGISKVASLTRRLAIAPPKDWLRYERSAWWGLVSP